MKNINKLFLCLFAVASLGFAQTTTTSTTFSAAVGSKDTTITLASSTGVLASGLAPLTNLYSDREEMTAVANVSSLGTGNVWTVKRGVNGIQSSHVSGATVWVSVPGTFDLNPNDRVGACTSTTFAYLPLIMVKTGSLITCSNGAYAKFGSFNDKSVGAVVASATTIVVSNPVVHVSGTTAVATITAAGIMPGQSITLIPDGIFATTTAGNISLVSTSVVGKALIMTFDGTKFNPSY